ncbi:hypothetical protein Zmor_022084 [Zophobas morio]|uniref:Uncharacterized protein n=1 Tax=Zophobas morio TaxID=2755281 RepID=A0AA38HL49_9CUCU|nr:hypothetical protein Zmor_022084 [Zophobas morio]
MCNAKSRGKSRALCGTPGVSRRYGDSQSQLSLKKRARVKKTQVCRRGSAEYLMCVVCVGNLRSKTFLTSTPVDFLKSSCVAEWLHQIGILEALCVFLQTLPTCEEELPPRFCPPLKEG